MRVRIIILTCALAALFAARDAAAQALPGWNTKQFTFERIDADNVRLQREVEIEGEAGTANEGQKFFADDLQMNIKTGELSAIGNVVFMTPTARISADSVVFNTKTRIGTFNNASGIAQLGERGERNRSMFGTLEPDVYFYGADDREDRSRQVPHQEGLVHDLRAADPALGDRQQQRHAESGRLRRCFATP